MVGFGSSAGWPLASLCIWSTLEEANTASLHKLRPLGTRCRHVPVARAVLRLRGEAPPDFEWVLAAAQGHVVVRGLCLSTGLGCPSLLQPRLHVVLDRDRMLRMQACVRADPVCTTRSSGFGVLRDGTYLC